MSKITIALEEAVAAILSETKVPETERTSRQRANIDRAFVRILKLIAPRIRHFIRQYGLVAHWEDAEQCCAIAVHRAIHSYDPEKAQFTTFINWQIRGELQGLRFRLMADQRPSARKVAATTVSMHGISSSIDGEEMSLESIIEDEDALARTEMAASDYLARSATAALLDDFVKTSRTTAVAQLLKRPVPKRRPADASQALDLAGRKARTSVADATEVAKIEANLLRDRAIIEGRLFDMASGGEQDGVSQERARQISKRAATVMAHLSQTNPRFALMTR